ncbi:MAG: Hsp20/alpha crystallin family protein [Chitinophagaceae bacterium]|nr:Hsp20/alpha crystallin family protein [Chitinophagaceae bacterium]HRA12058.1 Hsp20/alpha crystallin family protein [Chitinophagaceae bacterium]
MLNVNFKQKPYTGSINNLVDELFTELPMFFKNDFNNTERKGSVPVNVKETANGYQLEVVAPGFEKADFKIKLDDSLLTISADNKIEEKKESDKQIRREYSYRSFKRSFTVDSTIDATKIDATYVNGVLILNLPKKEEVKASAKEIIIN